MPVLGKVVAVDPTLPRPVTVNLYHPAGKAKGVVSARFIPALDDEGRPELMQLTVQQVVMGVKALTKGGYLQAADKRRLRQFLDE